MSADFRINPDEWVMKTPYGPMVHRDTGESYQARMARLEHEWRQRLAPRVECSNKTLRRVEA